MENGHSTARYGLPGQPSLATLACDPAQRSTILWRTGTATAVSTPVTAIVITTTGTRRVVNAAPDPAGGASTRLASTDALLDAIAYSRGRFMLEMPENQPLYLPAWPEITRVVEDCRKG
jgi:hypothetical protein